MDYWWEEKRSSDTNYLMPLAREDDWLGDAFRFIVRQWTANWANSLSQLGLIFTAVIQGILPTTQIMPSEGKIDRPLLYSCFVKTAAVILFSTCIQNQILSFVLSLWKFTLNSLFRCFRIRYVYIEVMNTAGNTEPERKQVRLIALIQTRWRLGLKVSADNTFLILGVVRKNGSQIEVDNGF